MSPSTKKERTATVKAQQTHDKMSQPERPNVWQIRLRWLLSIGVFGGVVWWSAAGAEFNFEALVNGLPFMGDFLKRAWPPNFSSFPRYMEPTLETIQMAIIGTLIAALISLPLAFLAAFNVTPHPSLRVIVGGIFNIVRAIPDLAFALLFVSAVGLGSFAGVMALGVTSIGMLGKLYTEAIENIDKGPIEAMEAVGASRIQIMLFGVVPQVLPLLVAHTLFRWEINIRAATVLGLVGAGGIGFHLLTSMRLFQYQNTSMILLIIVALVILLDQISAQVRQRLL